MELIEQEYQIQKEDLLSNFQSACELYRPLSCACTQNGQGNSHGTSYEGLCNLFTAKIEYNTNNNQ